MILYHNPLSANCRRVTMTAAYLGLPLEEKTIDFTKGDHKTPEYLAMNANGMIPTLTDGDFKLWESRAIIQYLAAKKPERGMLGKNEREQADVMRWMMWDTAHLSRHVGTVLYETVVKKLFNMGPPDEAAVKAALEQIQRFYGVLDTNLKGKKYLTGDSLTLADLSVAPTFTYADRVPVSLDDYPNIKAWLARITTLDCWKKTQPVLPM